MKKSYKPIAFPAKPKILRMEVSADGQELIVRIPIKFASEQLQSVVAERRASSTGSVARLTNREKQVYDLIVKGKVTKEIASEINLTVRTVKFHMSALYRKFGVRSYRELYSVPEVRFYKKTTVME